MIVKKIANPDKTASLATRVSALLSYVRAPETENADEKCTHYGTVGLVSLDPDEHAQEMIDLAWTAHQTRDPIIHYVLSWPEHERPTRAQVDDAVKLFLAELDTLPKPPKLRADHSWREHQWVYALHEDTDHMHVHLVGNRVDPQSNRAIKINRGFDADAGIRAGAWIEHVQGWSREPNKRFEVVEDPAGDRVVRTSVGARHALRRPTQRDLRREQQTGRPSATRIAIERALPIIARARSWAKLHEHLGEAGMAYVRSGAGAVLMVEDVPVKTSRIDTAATLEALTKRLGPFEPPAGKKPHPLNKQELAKLIAGASTWPELHTDLAAQNCTYERKGRGAIVRGRAEEWKASDLARDTSHKRLEDRLGPYTEAPAYLGPRLDERGVIRTTPERAAELIAEAKDWQELHDSLRRVGAKYTRKGSGAMVWLGDREMKASDVSRYATVARLERRLGLFEPPYAEAETTTEGEINRSYNKDRARKVTAQRRASERERHGHVERIAQIDAREQRELGEVAKLFPRPSRMPTTPARDDDKPSMADTSTRTDTTDQEREARILHDAVTHAVRRKARRARAKENSRFTRVLAELRQAVRHAASKFDWALRQGLLKPADGWNSSDRDAVIRPNGRSTADTAIQTDIGEVTALRVGERVDYRDTNDDLACADLGPEIIVRHPSRNDRKLAGLRLARQKWRGASVEVVNLPPPGEVQRLDDKKPRVIEDIHEEIRKLKPIEIEMQARALEALRKTGELFLWALEGEREEKRAANEDIKAYLGEVTRPELHDMVAKHAVECSTGEIVTSIAKWRRLLKSEEDTFRRELGRMSQQEFAAHERALRFTVPHILTDEEVRARGAEAPPRGQVELEDAGTSTPQRPHSGISMRTRHSKPSRRHRRAPTRGEDQGPGR